MSKPLKHLYKYRSFSVNTLRLLTGSELYYAKPMGFNDPLDCQPTIVPDTDIAKLEKLFLEIYPEKTGGREFAKKEIGRIRYNVSEYGDRLYNSKARDYYVRWLASDVLSFLNKEMAPCGVLSLAEKWDCPLMWSHYADEHRGLCIEFDLAQTNFQDLRPVSYKAPRAVKVSDIFAWKITGDIEAKNRVFSTYFFAKAPQWKYEREWRDVDSKSGSRDAPAPVASVIFGMRCEGVVIDAVVRLLANSKQPVSFYRMRPVDANFKLKRIQLDASEILSQPIEGPAFLRADEFADVVFDNI